MTVKGIEVVISDPHGTYTFDSPVIAENINNLLVDYRKATTPEERAELENKIELLYKDTNIKK